MWLADDRNMPLMCMKIVLPDDAPITKKHAATRIQSIQTSRLVSFLSITIIIVWGKGKDSA